MNAVHSLPSSTRRWPALQRAEWGFLIAAIVLLALAVWGPHLPASAHQHNFADQRGWWGLPCALDVLSNLPFAVAGVWGLVWLRRLGALRLCLATRATAALFFVGLVLTTAGSAWYHWQPDDAGLLWDRLGMSVAFAGLLGLAVVVGIGQGLTFPSTVALIGNRIAASHIGMGLGFYGALRNLGKVAGPIIVGALLAALADVAPHAEIMLMGAEDPGALIHAPDESVDLEELERMVLAEALMLARLGGLLSE